MGTSTPPTTPRTLRRRPRVHRETLSPVETSIVHEGGYGIVGRFKAWPWLRCALRRSLPTSFSNPALNLSTHREPTSRRSASTDGSEQPLAYPTRSLDDKDGCRRIWQISAPRAPTLFHLWRLTTSSLLCPYNNIHTKRTYISRPRHSRIYNTKWLLISLGPPKLLLRHLPAL